MRPYWLENFIAHMGLMPSDLTAEQIAEWIHDGLELVEVRKYATPKSRFTFELSGATLDDAAAIRKHLTPFENSIVEIVIR
jgi:hypothetical protein